MILLAGRYEILSTIKSGAMGSVFIARDTRLNFTVAVKKMIFTSSNPDEIQYAEERFMEEGRLLSELHHEGLPKVIDYFREADPETGQYSHYLVMTFMEGKDLDTLMLEREKKPLPPEETLNYLRQILQILEYLHSQIPPVIYRDLKPSNIMIDRDRAYLVDFGIARIFQPQQKGTAVGTPGYAAPEQYKGFAEPRSDLYSLGVVLHYLCTGIDPEDGSHSPFSFDSPTALNPEIPKSLNSTIMSMVQVIPGKRPPSAKHLLTVLNPSRTRALAAGKSVRKAGLVLAALLIASSIAFIVSSKLHDSHSIAVNMQSTITAESSAESNKSGATAASIDRYSTEEAKKALKEMNISYSEDALRECIKNSDIIAIKLFLISGIKPDVRDTNNGNTLLQLAAVKGSKDIAELLLSKGADINSKNNESQTPLHFAAFNGETQLVKMLLSKGAELNAKDCYGFTPLHNAASNGNKETVEYLISKGAGINIRTSRGSTPLHLAVSNNHRDAAQSMLSKGADVNAKDEKGRTPLHYASSKNAVYDLISQGAEVNIKSKDGDMPLHIAAGRNDDDTVEALIKNGADVSTRNNAGMTPLSMAMKRGYHDTVKVLLKYNAKD
ncbi:MAG: ankyrin repeat domain-containing protein [Candidatus Xenobiia bacterium LiM19]